MKTLSIIIPFLNEEKTLNQILDKIINLDLGLKKEIILVNDGSTDKSEEIYKDTINHASKGDLVNQISTIYIKNETNKGKGFSLKEGFKKASGDYFIIQDADLEYDPNDYKRLIEKLENENLDFVYGSRTIGYFKSGFHYSYLSFFFGGLLVSVFASIFAFKIITDEPTCYKLFKSNLKEYLIFPNENGFEWEPAITILLSKKQFKYGEIWIKYFPRKTIEGKKIKWTDGIKAITTIIKRRFKTYRHSEFCPSFSSFGKR